MLGDQKIDENRVGKQCLIGYSFGVDFWWDLGSIFDGFRDDILDVECWAGNWG